MKRKIIKQKNNAYQITLPISWIRENGINKDSEVDLEVSGREILVKTDDFSHEKKIKLDFRNVSWRSQYTIIASAYCAGVDQIEIHVDKDITNDIYKFLNTIMGYALVEQTSSKLVIKYLSPGGYDDIDMIFKRVFQMIILFFDSANKDIYGAQEASKEEVFNRDMEVNKFCLYLMRAINKMSYQCREAERAIFTFSYLIENIGDEIRRMWQENSIKKTKKPKGMQEVSILSKEVLQKAFFVFQNFNHKKVDEIYTLRNEVRKKAEKIKTDNSSIWGILRHIINIAEMAADISHLTIMKNL
jgi:phosphate uptake regulator